MVPEAAPARSRWSSARVSVSERRMQAFLHHRLQPAEPHPVLPRAAASVQLPRARLHQSFLHEGIYLFIYVILYIFILLQFFIFKKIFFQDCGGGKKKKITSRYVRNFCETRYASVITRNKTAWITFSLSKCLVVVVVCCWHAEMKTLCFLLVTAALILLLILLFITYKLLLVRTEYFSQLLL